MVENYCLFVSIVCLCRLAHYGKNTTKFDNLLLRLSSAPFTCLKRMTQTKVVSNRKKWWMLVWLCVNRWNWNGFWWSVVSCFFRAPDKGAYCAVFALWNVDRRIGSTKGVAQFYKVSVTSFMAPSWPSFDRGTLVSVSISVVVSWWRVCTLCWHLPY